MARVLVVLFTCLLAGISPAVAQVPRFDRVLLIVLENTAGGRAVREPYLAELAQRGALLTELSATTHPSQPNYIALVSGDTHGVSSNDPQRLDAMHLGDLLDAKRISWKTYAQGFPGDCSLVEKAGAYARKHVPFLSFASIQNDPEKCGRIVPDSVFDTDLAAGTLPEFSLYIPDNNANGHDTGVGAASSWLKWRFGPLFDDAAFLARTLVIITFDEGVKSDNRVYTVFLGRGVKAGLRSDRPYTHYSLLRTIEDGFRLGTLGRGDAKAAPISEVFD